MRRFAVALCALGGLVPAAAKASFWTLPQLDPATARAIVAAGGAVELALYVPDAPVDFGRRQALLPRGHDPAEEPDWQRARLQAVCPLGAPLLGEGSGWVRVQVDQNDALERVLAAGLVLAPIAPAEVIVGESLIDFSIAPLPSSWAPPSFSCAFARGQREARWLYGDWDGDGVREVGKYVPGLDAFLLDANGNGLWDGVAGGDTSAWVAAAAGPGEPLVGDWNGDGVESVGKAVGAVAYLDANESLGWDGRAGGDEVTVVAPGRPEGMYVVGDWDGDGRDQLGRYEAALGRFLLDADGNGRWDGAAGGDRRVDFAVTNVFPVTGLEPFVADFDGAPGDGVGLGTLWRVMADLDEDGVFAGAAGGDLDLWIALTMHRPCFCGVELPPRPSGSSGSSGLYFPGSGFTLHAIELVQPDEPLD